MNNIMTRNLFRLILAVVFLVLSAGTQAGFQEAEEAHNKGNYPLALKEYKLLADKGDVKAQHILGVMYASGHGVPQDYKEAAAWFRMAAEQGDVNAQLILGVMYFTGQGVAHNHDEAVAWYRKAAEQGNVKAQASLGLMYAKGQNLPQDLVQAHMWFSLAGSEADADAIKAAEARMTLKQIEAADSLVQEWRVKHK